ncbi:hypothetical protein JQN58_06400 [Aneurinibacillus sp. BA2021]|nr:hypothetical protein [Aneurinibacillus sp. BA2021]
MQWIDFFEKMAKPLSDKGWMLFFPLPLKHDCRSTANAVEPVGWNPCCIKGCDVQK